jgi:Flp pilus assembly pilin Flp
MVHWVVAAVSGLSRPRSYLANRRDKGASMVEYALLIVLIGIVALVAIRLAGHATSNVFRTVGVTLTNPAGARN